jgi:PAS domain-containing protein
MADLRREVSALSGDTIIIHLSIYQDGAGKSYIPRDALSQVAQAASVPIYGYYDSYFGTGGIIGGFLTSFEIEASNATRLGLRILGGEKPEEVSTAGANSCAYMFDWRELKRWGISDASLPPGSIVRSRSPGFWDLYRWHVITVICIGALEVVLILALLVQRARRRRAEKERQQADEQFRLVVECTPSSMVMATASGTVVLVNGQVEKSFGYCREELVGRRVEILLPERFRSKHPKHRAGFVFSPAFRGPAPLPLPVLTAVGPSAAFIGRPRTKHECSSIFLMAKFNRGSWSMENPQAGANQ